MLRRSGFGASSFLGLLSVLQGSRPPTIKGLKERPLKGPLGLYRGFMRRYKGNIRVRKAIRIRGPF